MIVNALFMMAPALAVRADRLVDRFGFVRHAMLSGQSILIDLALAVAGILFAVNLISIGYELMGDEQQSGLGGITFLTLVRPVGVLALLSLFNVFVWGFDGAVNGVTTSIVHELSVSPMSEDEAFADLCDVIESQSQDLPFDITSDESVRSQAKSIVDKIMEKSRAEADRRNAEAAAESAAARESAGGYGVKFDEWQPGSFAPGTLLTPPSGSDPHTVSWREDAKWRSDKESEVARFLRNYTRGKRKLTRIMTKTATLSTIFFDTVYGLVQAFAELYLIVLAVFGPITLCLSLYKPWNGAFKSWIGRYVEVSFWKVTAAVIVWACTEVKRGAVLMSQSDCLAALRSISEGGYFDGNLVSVSAACWTTTIISIAGLLAMSSVSSITSAALSLLSGPAMGGAQSGESLAGDMMQGKHLTGAAKDTLSTMSSIKSLKR